MGLFSAPLPLLDEDDRAEVSGSLEELTDSVRLFDEVRGRRAWQLLLLAVLNLLDVATTVVFLRLGVSEGNPLLVPIVHMWWAPLLLKAAIFVVIVAAVARCPLRSRAATTMLSAAVAYYCVVVGWNLWVILGH